MAHRGGAIPGPVSGAETSLPAEARGGGHPRSPEQEG